MLSTYPVYIKQADMQETEAFAVPSLHKAAPPPLACGLQVGQQGICSSESLLFISESDPKCHALACVLTCLLLWPLLHLHSRDLLGGSSVAALVHFGVEYFVPPS